MNSNENLLFQVSVKGLHFNDNGELLMIQEDTQKWELPGGRIQANESFIECLKRECIEETGLECEVLDPEPTIVYPTIDQEGHGRIMVFFKIKFNSLDFVKSNECMAIKFYPKNEIPELNSYPQLKPLLRYL